ncbi:MAG: tetratricopeptide repeat protein [Acidobacteria bacterium]|nr:tetratricopeptide repeat protein [Acidobacteriota bacterium]
MLLLLLGAEIANASYLASTDAATIFYHANVFLHVAAGIPLAVWMLWRAWQVLVAGFGTGLAGALTRVFQGCAALVALTGVYLTWYGTATPYRWALVLHIAAFIAGAAALFARESMRMSGRLSPVAARSLVFVALAIALPIGMRGYDRAFPPKSSRIENPVLPPATPGLEGAGDGTPFFPSSVRTVGDRLIPSDFFLESKSCGNKGCHPDIVAQWEGSAHHFSSFNNQWYRKSIEYMQDVVGTKPSKWCGGCHDMAILFTGRMDTPIREQIHTPEAQAGIGCMACHSVVHVDSTMGQGGYTIEYPEMHRLVASENPILRFAHDQAVKLDPAPHKATLLKAFHRQQTPEFCSSCHKVHLDAPVNHYRWFRGFNDYDAWQQSGVSMQGARAFYYPPEAKKCGSCHMPLVTSGDAGNVDGKIHSHRFPGANTALPFVNKDINQFEAVKNFLTSGAITVDVFGLREEQDGRAAPADGAAPAAAPAEEAPVAQTMLPGEEGVSGEGGGPARRLGPVVAPLDTRSPALRPGETVRVEVVVRTRNIGHFFPGGTVDAFDTWTELVAQDETGRVIGHSGWIEDAGRGPVEKEAHFYRSVLLDAHGNRINKRNAWSARAVLYARLIPPGAADTVHFRLTIPSDVGERVTLTARLNYRKFSWWNTQWSFAGVRDPGQPKFDLSADYDDGNWVFNGDTSDVSGTVREIPNLPTIVVSAAQVTLPVERAGRAPLTPAVRPEGAPPERERFNDYGIGLLLQRDYKGAEEAFRRVVALDPNYVDGYVNIARALVEEGDHRHAAPELEQALALAPDLPKAHYFYALTLKAAGKYEDALDHLDRAAAAFPRDRVVLDQIGRIDFLLRRYDAAIAALKRTLAVDPEDLQAHYNLMLAYRGKGDDVAARAHEVLYERFKLDESSQALTGPYRAAHPEDNNERLLVHEHEMRVAPAGEAYKVGALK